MGILKLTESLSGPSLKKKETNPRFVREQSVVTCIIGLARNTALDTFSGTQQLKGSHCGTKGEQLQLERYSISPSEQAVRGTNATPCTLAVLLTTPIYFTVQGFSRFQ